MAVTGNTTCESVLPEGEAGQWILRSRRLNFWAGIKCAEVESGELY
jgi:hypothetical protein